MPEENLTHYQLSSQTGLSEGIARNAEAYEGLYESLLLSVSPGKYCSDVYEEWCDRVALLEDSAFRAEFERKFSKDDVLDRELCLRKMRMLVGSVQRAGFIRAGSSDSVIVYDNDAAQLFRCLGEIAPGARCTVIKPAWTLGGKAVELGIVRAESDSDKGAEQ